MRRIPTYHVRVPELPCEDVIKGSVALGIYYIIFGLMFSWPAVFVVQQIATDQFDWPVAWLLLFPVIGLSFIFYGIKTVSLRRVIRFENGRVIYDERTLLGHVSWSEPLERYEGIRSWSVKRSSGKNRISYYVHSIEMYHPEKRKRILLYRTGIGSSVRQMQEHYCKVLNLPAITDYGKEKSVRASGDVDKSVLELASEGKINASLDFLQSIPKGASISYADGEFRIDLPHVRLPVAFTIVWCLFSVIFCLVGFAIPGTPIVFGIAGILFILVFLGLTVWNTISHMVIYVGAEHLRCVHQTPWGELSIVNIDLSQVESIHVGRRVQNEAQISLLIATDFRTYQIGQGLPRPVLDWTKKCIYAIVSGELDADSLQGSKSDFA